MEILLGAIWILGWVLIIATFLIGAPIAFCLGFKLGWRLGGWASGKLLGSIE